MDTYLRFPFIYRAMVFVSSSALCWVFSNDFNISTPDGYDPLRYAFYAINGLPPEFSGDSSYRVVNILSPFFTNFGYWSIIFINAFLLTLVARVFFKSKSYPMLNWITFYYSGQPGKDFLNTIVGFVFFNRKIDFLLIVCFVSIVSLMVYIRPAFILFLPIIAFGRFNLFLYFLYPIIAGFLFLTFYDLSALTSFSEVAANDESSLNIINSLRISTSGYSTLSITLRFLLYIISIFLHPVVDLLKFINSGELYLLFSAFCSLVFLINLKNVSLFRFIWLSMPFVLVVSVFFPFFHYRYVEVYLPVVLMVQMFRAHNKRC